MTAVERTGEEMEVGIDLGTTCIEASTISPHDTAPTPFALGSGGKNPMSSTVCINKDGTPIVGDTAHRNSVHQPENSIQMPKRFAGTDKVWTIHGQDYTTKDAFVMQLKHIDALLERTYPGVPRRYTITCPANYDTEKRSIIKQAAEEAGIVLNDILNEPTAAALSFFRSSDNMAGKNVVVFDLGGGTLDVSFMKCVVEDGLTRYEVISSEGVEFLGGSDWTAALYKHNLQKCSEATGMSIDEIRADVKSDYQLRAISEDMKLQLSEGDVSEPFVMPCRPDTVVPLEITRAEFEEMTAPLLKKCIDAFDTAHNRARNLGLENLDNIVLVGGASRMPQIREAFLGKFPEMKDRIMIRDPEMSISKGAAIYGAMGMKIDEVLTETFGVSAMKIDSDVEICVNHLQMGTRIPCEQLHHYCTRYENQRKVRQVIYSNHTEGESTCNPDNCKPIGEMFMDLPAGLPKGTTIVTTMSVATNGILTLHSQCSGVDVSQGFRIIEKKTDAQSADPFNL